ncbi:MAG: hypothetical protein WC989_07190 [Micavibrio sp.]
MSDLPHLKTVSAPASGYSDLKYFFANLNTLFSIRGMMAIDMMTAMPAGGMQRRLHDISAVTRRIYAETTTNTIARLLDDVENKAEAAPGKWNDWDLANLAEMRRIHKHLSSLPPDLYLASIQYATEGRKRHESAAGENWKQIAPYISNVVDLYRRIAEHKQKSFDARTPYKALLLDYASDISIRQIDALYNELLEPLSALRTQALEKQREMQPPLPIDGEFNRGDQMWLNRTILEIMGFDFTRGTLQVTAIAPFAGGNPDDTRVLIRCGDSESFLHSMEDTLYQGARGLYLQNLPADWMTQPVGQDLGNLMMNAQSILYETILGRTPQFFDFIATRAEGVFRQFRNASFAPENLYRLRKIIRPSARRNEADELTKIFHDVMRYQIERDLIDDTLSVTDLPERWNEESRKYLGILPQGAEEGPMQNPDWFTGRFGFIPTNTLSHIIAASLHEKLYQDLENLPEMVSYGDFRSINQWLKTRIHEKGRSVPAMKLIEDVTGKPLSAGDLLTHLERRYLSDRR